MTAQPSGFLYPQDLPDAVRRLKVATAGDQRAAIALDVLLLEMEARDSENYRELRAMQRRAHTIADYAITEERRQVGRHILTGEDGN